MCRADRPETRVQTKTHQERESCASMSLTFVGIKICPGGGITMTTSGVGKVRIYDSIFGLQLAPETVSLS